MVLWSTLLACRPESAVAIALAPSAQLDAVLVATVTGAPDAGLRLRDADGERVLATTPTAEGARAALIGLPAGEPFELVPVVDGIDGEPRSGVAPEVPDGWPTWRVTLDDATPAASFLVSVTDPDRSGVGVVDAAGRWRWWVAAPDDRTFASPRLTPDGTGVVWTSQDRERGDEVQFAHTVAFDGATRTDVALRDAHHVVEPLPDGRFAWLAWDLRDWPYVDEVPERVAADRVRVGAGDGDEHDRFSFVDRFGPPAPPCDHGTEQVLRHGELAYEWSHANSLAHEPRTDRLVVGSRLLDAVVAVDAETGEVAWQLGGEGASLRFERGTTPFSHPHFSQVDSDRVLLFDNGVHHDPQASRVLEVTIDEDRGTASVTRVVPLRGYWWFLGDARWRDDGGLLVATSEPGNLLVFDADDRATWRLEAPSGTTVGRVRELTGFPP